MFSECSVHCGFECPAKYGVVSHPVNKWEARSAQSVSAGTFEWTSFIGMYCIVFAVPDFIQS